MNSNGSASAAKWAMLQYHRSWLLDQANGLFDFFEPHSIDPSGGFFFLDDRGHPIAQSASGEKPPRQLHATTRMVHCFSIARLLGRPGADRFIDQGMDFLWRSHRDLVDGGYFWSVGPDGPMDRRKQAYGHA